MKRYIPYVLLLCLLVLVGAKCSPDRVAEDFDRAGDIVGTVVPGIGTTIKGVGAAIAAVMMLFQGGSSASEKIKEIRGK